VDEHNPQLYRVGFELASENLNDHAANRDSHATITVHASELARNRLCHAVKD
jgi:hypothetical protein